MESGPKTLDFQTRRRLSARLRELMEFQGTNESDLGRKLGVSRSYVNRLLHCEVRPGLAIILALHRQLGLTYEKLLEFDPKERRFFEGLPERDPLLPAPHDDGAGGDNPDPADAPSHPAPATRRRAGGGRRGR